MKYDGLTKYYLKTSTIIIYTCKISKKCYTFCIENPYIN
jgi:hypothetical protein